MVIDGSQKIKKTFILVFSLQFLVLDSETCGTLNDTPGIPVYRVFKVQCLTKTKYLTIEFIERFVPVPLSPIVTKKKTTYYQFAMHFNYIATG